MSKRNSVPEILDPKHFGSKNLEGVQVPRTIGSLHTKSWPPTMPRTLQKVSGRWWVVGGTYTKFSVLLWAKALVLT